MPRATVTSKGQITLPKTIRDRLGLTTGDQVEFLVGDDGSIAVVSVKRSAMRLHGAVPFSSTQPPSIDDMNRAIADRVADDDDRIRGGQP